MDGMTTFTSDKESLQDILEHAARGKTALQEFQLGIMSPSMANEEDW
jgi:hypothetical protein